MTRPATIRPRRWLCVALATAFAAFGAVGGAAAQADGKALSDRLLAKAPSDECYYGVGDARNVPLSANPTCPSGSVRKVNQAYVWGLAATAIPAAGTDEERKKNNKDPGSRLWFGTAANVVCLVLQSYLGITDTIETPSYVCEGAARTATPAHTDWRPPKLYVYDTKAKALTDLSSKAPALNLTLGIRSAGALGDVVFFGGPAVDNSGVYLFAFRNDASMTFLGSTKLAAYNNIRQWTTFNGGLYTGVRVRADGTGRVLRWLGVIGQEVFNFEEVGATDSDVAYLTSLNSRLYVTTWGGLNSPGRVASGVWVSPQAGKNAPLTAANLNQWVKIWDVSRYEPDPVTAATVVGGAISAYQNKIYWGMMQVPFTGVAAHFQACPSAPQDQQNMALALVNTTRAIPVFRSDGNANPAKTKTELLYGSEQLPVWDCANAMWKTVANPAKLRPAYGQAGFGNPFNTYTWASAVFDGKLYFGTFDWSYVASESLEPIAEALNITLPTGFDWTRLVALLGSRQPNFGADLWRFDNALNPAKAESTDGLGNILNYGIRTMIVTAKHLYVGTANPMNLKTTEGAPKGGWELHDLQAR